MRFIFSQPVEELTHEQIAAECRNSKNSELVELGEKLQDAVDAEQDSQAVVNEITDLIDAMV